MNIRFAFDIETYFLGGETSSRIADFHPILLFNCFASNSCDDLVTIFTESLDS